MTNEELETAFFFVRSALGPEHTDEQIWDIVRVSVDAVGETWPS